MSHEGLHSSPRYQFSTDLKAKLFPHCAEDGAPFVSW